MSVENIPENQSVAFVVASSPVQWKAGRLFTDEKVVILRGSGCVPMHDQALRFLRWYPSPNPSHAIALAIQDPRAPLAVGKVPGCDGLEVLASIEAPGPHAEVFASHPMITAQALVFAAKKNARLIAARFAQ